VSQMSRRFVQVKKRIMRRNESGRTYSSYEDGEYLAIILKGGEVGWIEERPGYNVPDTQHVVYFPTRPGSRKTCNMDRLDLRYLHLCPKSVHKWLDKR
jgi:hypothetical protein